MQEINNYIKENDTDNVEIQKMKEIIQTLSKVIPDDRTHSYKDEFDKIGTNIEALELLNKRLKDMVPRTRTIKFSDYTNTGTSNINDIEVNLSSLGKWDDEYNSNGSYYVEKKAFIEYGYINVKVTSSDVYDSNRLYFAEIDEGDTRNYTEMKGYVPCLINYKVDNVNKYKLGFVEFYENFLCLICEDWSFLSDTPLEINLTFNGVVKYESYEYYAPRTT